MVGLLVQSRILRKYSYSSMRWIMVGTLGGGGNCQMPHGFDGEKIKEAMTR
jgi:hypothetical protein